MTADDATGLWRELRRVAAARDGAAGAAGVWRESSGVAGDDRVLLHATAHAVVTVQGVTTTLEAGDTLPIPAGVSYECVTYRDAAPS